MTDTATPRSLTHKGKLFRLMAGTVLGLLTIEVALQIGAYVTWSAARHALEEQFADQAEGVSTVLCVGDSVTYGTGASDLGHSYPAALERGLCEAGGESWRTVNAGWPGVNSSEVLQLLPERFRRTSPRYVCLLVGANNQWSRTAMDLDPPENLTSGSGTAGEWTWSYRTLRFLRVLRTVGGVGGSPEPETSVAAALEGPQPSERGRVPVLSLIPRETSPLEARPPGPDAPPAPTPEQRREISASLNEAKDLWEGGRTEESRVSVDAVLEELLGVYHAPLHGRAVALLGQQVRLPETAELGLECIERYGPTPILVRWTSLALARLQRFEEAHALLDEATELQPYDAALYRSRGLVHLYEKDTAAYLRDVFRAFSLDGRLPPLERHLRRAEGLGSMSAEKLEAILDGLDLEEGAARWIRSEFQSIALEERGVDRLEEDLCRLVELVRAAGATPIVLTYPGDWTTDSVHSPILAAAVATDCHLIDLKEVFAPSIKTMGRDHYFVPDGHPSDEGYALMARLVQRAVLDLDATRESGAGR